MGERVPLPGHRAEHVLGERGPGSGRGLALSRKLGRGRGDGSEIDVYGGVALERAGVELSLGGTGYIYTGEFDDPYVEGNLGAGYGPFTVDLALGQYLTEPETLDYTYLQVTTSVRGAYATLGTFGGDFSGRFGEVGYGFVVSDVDCRVGWVLSDPGSRCCRPAKRTRRWCWVFRRRSR
jgi:hypothetical protein